MKQEDVLSIIHRALFDFSHYEQELAVLLIIHMQTDSIESDYDEFSIVTSYYSDIEYQEILLAFKNVAAYVDVSYGEKEFIGKVQGGSFSHLKNYKKVAYAQTASGIVRSKSALIPAICSLYQIKYFGNDIFTGAMLDNKLASSKLFKSIGIRLPDTWVYYYKTGWLEASAPKNHLLICKPAYECASIGVTEDSVSELTNSYLTFIHKLSLQFKQPILVQSFIEGFEVEVPILELESSVVPGITGISLNKVRNLGKRILTYNTIFEDEFDLYNFKEQDKAISELIEKDSLRAYNTFQLKGPVRMDYRITKTGEYYLMDYNNSPHLGAQHSFAFTIKKLGFTYEDLLKLVIYPSLLS